MAKLTPLERELLAALEIVTGALENWIEIQDEEDARLSDELAIRAAHKAMKHARKANG